MVSRHISHSIDVIRGLSCLGVIYGHSVYGFKLPIELNGAFWVWIFLPISGYLVGKGFLSSKYKASFSGYKKFISNRFLRILPLFQIALFIGVIFECFVIEDKTPVANMVKQFFMVTSNVSLAGPLWTVITEVHFYIISIFIFLVVQKLKSKWFLLLFLFFSFCFAGVYNVEVYGHFFQPRTLAGNFHFFVFGMVLSMGQFDNYFTVSSLKKYLTIFFLVILAWYVANFQSGYFWKLGTGIFSYIPLGGASLIALIISFVVLCVQVPDNDNFKRLRVLKWLGFYTYGIYVWHSVLAKGYNTVFTVPVGLNRLLYLLLSIPIAVVSYKLIEGPLLRFKKK